MPNKLSADGKEIQVGDTVWTQKWEDHKVKRVCEYKVYYEKPDSRGYIGARKTTVFKEVPGDATIS